MVRVLLVRPREAVGPLPTDDDRLSVRTAVPEAAPTAVLVEGPDVVVVPVDEVGLEAVSRVHTAVGTTPIVATTAERDQSLLGEAIAAGAADALSLEAAADTDVADRLEYALQRQRRQQGAGRDDGDDTTQPWRDDRQRSAPDPREAPATAGTVPLPSTADPAAVVDEHGRVLRAREPFERLVGRSIDRDEQWTLEQLLATDIADSHGVEAAFDPDRRHRDWEHLDVTVVKPDGTRCQLRGATVEAPEAQVEATSCPFALFLEPEATQPVEQSRPAAGADANDHHEQGTASIDLEDDIAVEQLLETTQTLTTAETPAAVAASVAATATELLGCDGAVCRRYEDGQLQLTATSGTVEETTVTATIAVGERTAGRAFQEQTAVRSTVPFAEQERPTAPGLATTGEKQQSMLAVPIERHGTLSVIGAAQSLDGGQQLVELLAATAATALDRIDRAGRIRGLLEETQSVLDARTPLAVCKRSLEAVRALVGDRAVVVYLREETGTGLEPVVWSERTEKLAGTPQSVAPGEGSVWETFEQRTLRSFDDPTETALTAGQLEGEMHVPLGDRGVIYIGSSESAVHDHVDEKLLQLLGVNVARTLERVQRQQELQEYEAAFEGGGHMMLLCDDSGEITHATEPLADQLGGKRPELVGSSILEHFEPDDRGRIRSALRRAADASSFSEGEDALGPSESGLETIETQLVTQAGESVPVTVEFDPLPGLGRRTVLTVHDRSELVEKQSQLARERDRFGYLFDHLPDAVVEVELDETGPLVTDVNSAFTDVFGYDADYVTGNSLNEIIVPAEQRVDAKQLDERALNGRINTKEVERVTDTGRRQFLFRGIPYELDGQETTYGFGIYTDITEQKERQQHLEVIHRVLRHNLRNDINVLLGGLDVLEPAVEGRKAQFLEDLRTTAQGLVRMSHKAKELAAAIDLDTDDCDPMNVERLVDRVVEIARDRYEDVSFATNTEGHVVQGNPDVLSSALLELVENAVEHGDADQIRLGVVADTGGVKLRVADDGPGIPEYERAVVTGGTITPLQHGSGLGLWLVRRAAKSCGGTVSFEENGPLSGGTVAIELHRTTPESDRDPSGEHGAQTS